MTDNEVRDVELLDHLVSAYCKSASACATYEKMKELAWRQIPQPLDASSKPPSSTHPSIHLAVGSRSLTGRVYAQWIEFVDGAAGADWVRLQEDLLLPRPSASASQINWDTAVVATYSIPSYQCYGPVYWSEELTSPDGMNFLLFPSVEATPADVKKCKEFLRDTRDVHRLRVQKIDQWRSTRRVQTTKEGATA